MNSPTPDQTELILIRLLADVDDAMEFHGTVFGTNATPKVKESINKALAAISKLMLKERLDELERLNLYYLQHDGEGEHKLAAQFDKRISELKKGI